MSAVVAVVRCQAMAVSSSTQHSGEALGLLPKLSCNGSLARMETGEAGVPEAGKAENGLLIRLHMLSACCMYVYVIESHPNFPA